jgi:hypothetical protein
MSEELIDSYVDRAAIAAETQFFVENINKIIDLFDKANSIKVSISGASSMKEIVTGANEAKKAVTELSNAKDKLTKSDILAAKAAKEAANQKTAEAKANTAAAKTTQEKTKADLVEAKALKELAAADKLLAQARKENAAAILKEQQAAGGSQREKEKAQINEIGRAYAEYSKAAREATLRAKSYALTLGENDPRTLAAIKNAKEMNETLSRVDASVGQFGRNVGNYKSGFDGLGSSFAQVSRELPSLTISVQQFALAISNNLPILADEVAKVSAEMKELKAQGKEVPSMFKRIASAALSFQVGLSIGIALLTAYAGKIAEAVSNLVDSEGATRKAAKQQQEYNERLEESIALRERFYSDSARNSGTEIRNLENQLAYARAAGKSEKEILEIERALLEQRQLLAQIDFNATGGETSLETLGKDLRIAQQNLDEFLIKERRSYDIFGNKTSGLTDKEKEQGEFLKKEFDLREKAYNRQKEVIEEYYNANRDAQIKDLEIKKLAAEQYAKFFALELQLRADNLKAFSTIEDADQLTRLNARKEALKNEQAIEHGQYGDALKAAKNNLVLIFEANREHTFNKKKLVEEYENDVLAIRQTSIARQREIDKQSNDLFVEDQQERINKQIDAAQNEVDRRQKFRAEGQTAEIEGLNKSYEAAIASTKAGSREREKVERTYAQRRADIEYSYGLAELKNQIWLAEQILKTRKLAGENVTEQETKLAELRMQLSDLETKRVLDNNAKQAKSAQDKFEATKRGIDTFRSVYSETTAFIDGLLGASIDKQKNDIEKQIEDIEKRKNAEIEAINATTQSTQEKAAAVSLVEAKAALQKEQLERKQAQLDQQRAKFEKAISIGRIITDTAAAVVAALGAKPWTPANIAFAAAVGAIGAGRLAVALATPIPKFKDGRDGGAETFAIVGDGGKREVVTSPDLSQAYVTPATDTLTYLKKDWKVFPDVDAFQTAAASMGNAPQLSSMPMYVNDNGDMIYAMKTEMGRLRNTISNKQENHIYWQNGEMRKAIKKANEWYLYIQNNF